MIGMNTAVQLQHSAVRTDAGLTCCGDSVGTQSSCEFSMRLSLSTLQYIALYGMEIRLMTGVQPSTTSE